jgi:hypothetical protein
MKPFNTGDLLLHLHAVQRLMCLQRTCMYTDGRWMAKSTSTERLVRAPKAWEGCQQLAPSHDSITLQDGSKAVHLFAHSGWTPDSTTAKHPAMSDTTSWSATDACLSDVQHSSKQQPGCLHVNHSSSTSQLPDSSESASASRSASVGPTVCRCRWAGTMPACEISAPGRTGDASAKFAAFGGGWGWSSSELPLAAQPSDSSDPAAPSVATPIVSSIAAARRLACCIQSGIQSNFMAHTSAHSQCAYTALHRMHAARARPAVLDNSAAHLFGGAQLAALLGVGAAVVRVAGRHAGRGGAEALLRRPRLRLLAANDGEDARIQCRLLAQYSRRLQDINTCTMHY